MRIFRYAHQNAEEWDALVELSINGTFLHTRRYLEYHGDRFKDVSVLIRDAEERLTGVLPAAIDLKDGKCVVSHPGITYGGIIHSGGLRGQEMTDVFSSLKSYFAEQGFKKLRYKPVPYIYNRSAASDDLYALFVHGAVRYRCDLSCAIDLRSPGEVSSRRKRSLKKANKAGVRVETGPTFTAKLWGVIEENLADKYGARAVHCLEEITNLQSLFPEDIRVVVGLLNDEVVAGVVLYLTGSVTHAQYIASSHGGYAVSALDAVFSFCIESAAREGKRWFDFGTSNENEGRDLNASLYQFKSEFGGGGVPHEFYELPL